MTLFRDLFDKLLGFHKGGVYKGRTPLRPSQAAKWAQCAARSHRPGQPAPVSTVCHVTDYDTLPPVDLPAFKRRTPFKGLLYENVTQAMAGEMMHRAIMADLAAGSHATYGDTVTNMPHVESQEGDTIGD